MIHKFSRKRRLRPLLLRHMVLLGGEFLIQLVFVHFLLVIPAKAGIQNWIPVYTGMTELQS